MTAAAKILFSAALLSVSLPVAADDQNNTLHPLVLYDAGGFSLVSCQIDAAGNVSGCSLNGNAKLDDLVQRMVEEMSAAQHAKIRMVKARLTLPPRNAGVRKWGLRGPSAAQTR